VGTLRFRLSESLSQSVNSVTWISKRRPDVDAFVPKDSPIDQFAASQTTTVYTGVRSAAQLTYDAVGTWLEGRGAAPAKVAASPGFQSQLRLQDEAAQALRNERYRRGALNIETIETRPVVLNDRVVSIENQAKNRATDLIEDFMIASNQIIAQLLDTRQVSSIRRVVKTPKRWDRMVEIASTLGGRLPAAPDSKALNDFLIVRKAADPDHFADRRAFLMQS
jgi:exoribonuclease-2